jgi:hypothetical protein
MKTARAYVATSDTHETHNERRMQRRRWGITLAETHDCSEKFRSNFLKGGSIWPDHHFYRSGPIWKPIWPDQGRSGPIWPDRNPICRSSFDLQIGPQTLRRSNCEKPKIWTTQPASQRCILQTVGQLFSHTNSKP